MIPIGRVFPATGSPQFTTPVFRATTENLGFYGEAPHRRLNHEVLADLRAGRVFSGKRRCGKSVTLLTYLAVAWPVVVLNGQEHGPIVVTETLAHANVCLRAMYRKIFAGAPEPRWMSKDQFRRGDGLTGVVFTDECEIDESRLCSGYLIFGGGVRSERLS